MQSVILSMDDHFEAEVDRIEREAVKYTLPIYIRENDIPTLQGSSVLIRISGRPFIITAGHVLDPIIPQNLDAEFDESHHVLLEIPTAHGLEEIQGQLDTNIPANGNRDDDPLDIAVLAISEETASRIESIYSFLDMGQIEVNHISTIHTHYFPLGYPENRTKARYKFVRSNLFCYLSKLLPETAITEIYSPHFQPFSHLIVPCDPKGILDMDGKKVSLPHLNGISGGGLWYFDTTEPIAQLKLVGIVIEQRRYKKEVHIISTRIHIPLAVLTKKYIELGRFVPASLISEVNIQ